MNLLCSACRTPPPGSFVEVEGLARRVLSALGAAHAMAPEQQRLGRADARSDLYVSHAQIRTFPRHRKTRL